MLLRANFSEYSKKELVEEASKNSQCNLSPLQVNGVSGDMYTRHGGVNGGSQHQPVNPLNFLADVAIDSDNNSIDGKKLKEALQERLQNTGGRGEALWLKFIKSYCAFCHINMVQALTIQY